MNSSLFVRPSLLQRNALSKGITTNCRRQARCEEQPFVDYCEHTSRRACPTHPSGQRRRRASAAVVPAPPSCRPAIRSHPRAPLDEPVVRPVVEWPVEMGRQAVRSRKIKGQLGNYRRDVALSGIASIFKEADRPTIFIMFGTPLSALLLR